jgi:hypothetical protein
MFSILVLVVAAMMEQLHMTGAFELSGTQQARPRTLLQSSKSDFLKQAETDDEWHPHDTAETTTQLLAGIWWQIAQAGTMVKGVSRRMSE